MPHVVEAELKLSLDSAGTAKQIHFAVTQHVLVQPQSNVRVRDSIADSGAIGATGAVAVLHAVEMVSEVDREAALITKMAHQQMVVQDQARKPGHAYRKDLVSFVDLRNGAILGPAVQVVEILALNLEIVNASIRMGYLAAPALVLQLTVGNAKVLLAVHGQTMALILLVMPHVEVVVPKLEPDSVVP